MTTTKTKQNIPKEWTRVKLGDISDLRKGLTYKSSHYSNKEDGMVFLTLKSIQRGGGFNTEGVKYYAGDYDERGVVKENDLVIANTDITRDAAVVGAPMLLPHLGTNPIVISMDLSVLDTKKDKVTNDFLYYLLQTQTARNFMRDHSSGSTVLHLKTKDVPSFTFSLPPLTEQQKIAEILSAIDKDIQKIDEIIIAAKKLKHGLMEGLFSAKAKRSKLSDVTILITKGTTPTTYGHPFIDEGINFFKIENIDVAGNINLQNCKHISEDAHGFLKRSQLVKGDVLFSIAGALGRIAVVESKHLPANTNQAVAIIRPRDISDSVYLSYALRTEMVKKQVFGSSVQLAQANISLGKLGEISMHWPNETERQRISEIMLTADEKISINQTIKDKLALLKKGLMQDLLSGKKRTV